MNRLEMLTYVMNFYNEFGNFCALTDDLLDQCNVPISKYDKVTYKNLMKALK